MARTIYQVGFETLREIAAATLTASFAAVGSATSFPCASLLITNTLDGDVYLSFDGTNKHIWLPSAVSHGVNYDTIEVALPKATTIYIMDGNSAPTAGRLAITVMYKK